VHNDLTFPTILPAPRDMARRLARKMSRDIPSKQLESGLSDIVSPVLSQKPTPALSQAGADARSKKVDPSY